MPSSVELPATDDVVRSAVSPRMGKGGAISPLELLATFGKEPDHLDRSKVVMTISVGMCAKLPSLNHIHEYGCRIAAKSREGKKAKLGREPLRPGETEHYRGSFFLNVGDIVSIPTECTMVTVEEWPTRDFPEHANIVLRPSSEDADPSLVSADRTGVLAGLRIRAKNPQSHICDCDLDIAGHFEAAILTLAAPL